jgi:ComF family protein
MTLKNELQQFITTLFSPLFPKTCFGCFHILVPGELVLCTFCRHELPLTHYHYGLENKMDQAFYGRVVFKKASALFYYNSEGVLKHCFQFLKYRKQEQIGLFFGAWHGRILKLDPAFPKIDMVVPVPIHYKKKKKRGYNQLSLYGKTLAGTIEAHFNEKYLVKTANTKTQTKKNRLLRSHASLALYQLKEPQQFYHKKILLIDDIMTTGATLTSCANAFKDCTGIQIYFATIAVVR